MTGRKDALRRQACDGEGCRDAEDQKDDFKGQVERHHLHGPEQRYNDIALWDWQRLPEAFAPDVASRCRRVTQTSELREASGSRRRTLVATIVSVAMSYVFAPAIWPSAA